MATKTVVGKTCIRCDGPIPSRGPHRDANAKFCNHGLMLAVHGQQAPQYGYGQVGVGGRPEKRTIPAGLQIDHLCRVRHGERGESFSAVNARKTQCPRGHPYDGQNTYGARLCVRCNRDTQRRSSARRRARLKAAVVA